MAVPANKIRIEAAMGSEGNSLTAHFRPYPERPVTYEKNIEKKRLRTGTL